MTTPSLINVTYHLPSPRAPQQLVILLHGLGASGKDIIVLASSGFVRQLPEAIFLAPDAPFSYDLAPGGRQWFNFQDRDHSVLLARMRGSESMLNDFIDHSLEQYGLDQSKLALVGFSQGAMMALHTALRRPEPCAAVLDYSGALIGGEYLSAQITSRPPVLLVHGDQDEVIPSIALTLAEEHLQSSGVEVTALRRAGLGHSIDTEGLRAGGEFLAKHLLGPALV